MHHINSPLVHQLAAPPFRALPDCGVLRFTRVPDVGPDVAYEAVQWLYQQSRGLEVDAGNLKTFLHLDIFRFGLTPANSRLRKLVVKMPIRPPSVGRTEVLEVVKDLGGLIGVPLGKDFVLAVRIHNVTGRESVHWLHALGKLLVLAVSRLVGEGIVVELWYHERDIWRELKDSTEWWRVFVK